MKLAISAVVASLALLQADASPTAADTAEVTRRSAAVGCGYHTVPLLRGYSAKRKDHFYTASASQMYSAIATTDTVPGAIPLYRTWSPTRLDHFYTVSESQRDNAVQKQGYKDEGVTGYVYGTQICGSVPLYRTFNPVAYDHFYTVNETEKVDFIDRRGYVDEGTAGFVFPPQ